MLIWLPHPAFAASAEPELRSAVAPANMAAQDSIFGSGTFTSPVRTQLAYGSEHFSSSGLFITELRFRPDYYYGRAFTSTVSQIQIRLSTSARDPDQLSRTFAENVGRDETVVFDGSLPLASAFAGPATGPKDFDIVIPLSQPFLYGPALGALLVDIRNFSGSGASLLSGQGRADDHAARICGGVYAVTGSEDQGIDALQIIYIPTNGPPLPPPRLVRGPYLQSGTTTNILIRWRTSRETDSRVQFGLAPHALLWSVEDAALTKDHSLTLTNLLPDTEYFYAVGNSETNYAGGPEYHFFTAPTNTRPVRIWALSDYGTTDNPYGYEENSAGVRDAYYAYTGSRRTDVWLTMGDNSQYTGMDADYQTEVFDIYPAMLRQNVIWPTIGNHDAAYFPTSFDYLDIFSPPTQGEAGGIPSNTKFYYSYDYANIHFVSLDSITAYPRTNEAMLAWLERDLAANTKDWLIAYWHAPPYTYGTHNSDNPADTWGAMVDMREVVLPILEAHGVDLVLNGHSHVYERSYLLDGHYGYGRDLRPEMIKDSGTGQSEDTGAYLKSGVGPAPHEGAVYVVAAVGGWNTGVIWGLPDHHPAMLFRIEERGSMVIDISTNRLEAKFLLDTGEIRDHFTILKGQAPKALRVVTYRLSDGQVRLQWKSIAGQIYHVEKTLTLEHPDWVPVSDVLLATGATTGWTNTPPPGAPTSFYRVKRVD